MSTPETTTILNNYFEKDTVTLGCIILIIVCSLIPFLVWKLVNKKKDIQSQLFNESYSVISIYICNVAIISLSF